MTQFGRWLQRQLEDQGLSQRAFAEKVGVASNVVWRHINRDHETDRRTVIKYAKFLGGDVDQALRECGFPVEESPDPEVRERIRIGNKIRAARESAELTQQQVAVRLGVHRATYRDWEAGVSDFPASAITRLASHLNVSVDDLIGIGVAKVVGPSTKEPASRHDLEQLYQRLREEIAGIGQRVS